MARVSCWSLRSSALVGALVLSALVGACRGSGRGRATAPTPAAPAEATDPAGDAADRARADSVKTAARDSVVRDSVARATLVADSLARDSAATRRPRRAAAGVSKNCVLDFSESPPETRLLYNRISETISNVFIGGGFIGRCQGENNRIRADSAEQFSSAGVVNLYGAVRYDEPGRVRLTSDRATYFTSEGRLIADGNVVITQLESGSTLTGSSVEYFRAIGTVPSRMIAPNRPTARLVEKDSAGRPRPAVTIVANMFEDRADSILLAWGNVVITREEINGRADSSSFDKFTERARLVRSARISNTDTTQAFVLTGDTIDMYNRNRQLERVLAKHTATATNEDLVVQAERIDMRLQEQKLHEAFAFGSGRARARTTQQNVEADSLRIRLPNQRVEEVRAIGNAIALGIPDTLKIRSEDRDMLRGDSVFALFDTTRAQGDTSTGAKVREISALGNATSLFQMASKEGPGSPPALNYVRGVRIYLTFDSGAIRDVRVDSGASGLYLEPVPDSLADSTGRRVRRPPPPATRPPSPREPPQPLPVAPFQPTAVSPASRRLHD